MKPNYIQIILPYIFVTCLTSSVNCFSQNSIKAYVAQNTAEIKNIEPDSIDFSDLKVIGDAIGNSTIVMLGEQDHGDAPTYLAKTRLVKYLHEKKGFNVLAFESDFFGLNYGWDRIAKGKVEIDDFIKKNIFPVWTACNTCSDLFFNYLPSTYSTKSPLLLTGFDSQQFLNYSSYHLKATVDSLFKKTNLDVVKSADYQTLLPLIDSLKKWVLFRPKDTVMVMKCREFLQSANDQLKSSGITDTFWLAVIDNLVQQCNFVLLVFKSGKTDLPGRDIQMAINLKWLVENKFKGQKIIVWAANGHIAKYWMSSGDSFLKKRETMGNYFTTTFSNPNDVFILGFTSLQGMAGRIGYKGYEVKQLHTNGFESWVDPNFKYAFTDFTKLNLTNPKGKDEFFLCGFGHVSSKATWNKVYDGMFFIKDNYRCVQVR
jgi:erythromycin esterase